MFSENGTTDIILFRLVQVYWRHYFGVALLKDNLVLVKRLFQWILLRARNLKLNLRNLLTMKNWNITDVCIVDETDLSRKMLLKETIVSKRLCSKTKIWKGDAVYLQ